MPCEWIIVCQPLSCLIILCPCLKQNIETEVAWLSIDNNRPTCMSLYLVKRHKGSIRSWTQKKMYTSALAFMLEISDPL